MKRTHRGRDHRKSAPFNAHLAPWGFVDDAGTVVTKGGDLFVVYRVAGVDYECLDHQERREVVRRFEAALRVLGDEYRLYQYIQKRRLPAISANDVSHPVVNEAVQRRVDYINGRRGELFEVQMYTALVYEGFRHRVKTAAPEPTSWWDRLSLMRWLSPSTRLEIIERELDEAIGELRNTADDWETQLADSVRPERLDKSETFQFLRTLVNFSPATLTDGGVPIDTHLDYFIADSHVEQFHTHLLVQDARVQVLSMKHPPRQTHAHTLQKLYAVPAEFLACLELKPIPDDVTRRDLNVRRRHFWSKRISAAGLLLNDAKDESLRDDSVTATVAQLGEALTDLEVHGRTYFECALTVLVHGNDVEAVTKAVAATLKVLREREGSFIQERYNALDAWLSMVPGNVKFSRRRIALRDVNVADLSFLFTLDTGQRISPFLQQEYLTVFETENATPYFYNLHHTDVGHTLIIGMTGSGKSFLAKDIITNAQKYQPFTTIFDLGSGYQRLANLLGGAYWRISLGHSDIKINPFALEPTPQHLDFLHSFVTVLLEAQDGYRLSDAEDRELYESILNIYVLDADQRRLFTLSSMLPRHLAQRLTKWIQGGRYGTFFDHVEDTLTWQDFQVFDLQGMDQYPVLLEALVFYVLHRVSARIYDPALANRLKLSLLDEAWRFIQHPRFHAYARTSLKLWRKQHGAMILATQSVDDFTSPDLLTTVVENCPNTFFLANPNFNVARYRELFHLNEMALEKIAALVPRRQCLLRRPNLGRVINLQVDPYAYALYTDTPLDNARIRASVEAHGLRAGIEQVISRTN
jgi:type IV secretion system protein TrbE